VLRPARCLVVAGFAMGASGCGGGGDGNTTFIGDQGPRTDYHAVALADMNGDGRVDIVAARVFIAPGAPDPGAVDVFLRDPADSTRFLPRRSFEIGNVAPYGIAVEDINRDELPDVLVSCTFAESGFRLLLQSDAGGGTLQAPAFVSAPAPVYEMGTADIDLDGLPDVIAALDRQLALFVQKTDAPGTFDAPVSIGLGSRRVVVADVDDDDLADVIAPLNVALAEPTLVYFLHSRAVPGTFEPGRTLSTEHSVDDVAVAQLGAGDGLDLAVGGIRGGIGSFKGAWTSFIQNPAEPGAFVRGLRYDTGDSITVLVQAADLNADGLADVVLGHRNSADDPRYVDVYLQSAPGQFSLDGRYVLPRDRALTVPEMYSVEVADLNGDDLVDIAVSTNEIFYLPQRGDAPGKFLSAVRVAGQRQGD